MSVYSINILHEYFGMKKLSAIWVPRFLTVDQKRNRVIISKQCLDKLKRNSNVFLRRYVTVDKPRIHYHTPEMKEQFKQWNFPSERAPKKAKQLPRPGRL